MLVAVELVCCKSVIAQRLWVCCELERVLQQGSQESRLPLLDAADHCDTPAALKKHKSDFTDEPSGTEQLAGQSRAPEQRNIEQAGKAEASRQPSDTPSFRDGIAPLKVSGT